MKVKVSAHGESVPVEKHAETLSLAEDTDDIPLGDRRYVLLEEILLVYGRGRAVVIYVGMDAPR